MTVLLGACQSQKPQPGFNRVTPIPLDAQQQPTTKMRAVYHSIDRQTTTLIVNHQVIPAEQINTVLDTLDKARYTTRVHQEKRIVEMTLKKK